MFQIPLSIFDLEFLVKYLIRCISFVFRLIAGIVYKYKNANFELYSLYNSYKSFKDKSRIVYIKNWVRYIHKKL